MKYHSNQYLYQPVQKQNFVHYYSFVKKLSAQDKDQYRKLQNKQKNQQAVFTDDLNDTVPFNISNLVMKRPVISQKSTRNHLTTLKQSNYDILQKRSLQKNSVQNKSSLGQVQLKSVSNKNQKKEQQNGQVYKQIIKVLEYENSNLKEHNKFLQIQYKNVQQQKSQLKEQICSSNNLDELETEIQRLRSMNIAYGKQIEQLKCILLKQVVAIHKKFNLVLSGNESSQVVSQLTNALKKSQMPKQTTKLQSLDYKLRSRNSFKQNKSISGSMLSQLLSIKDDDIRQKQSRKTVDTLNKENDSSQSNYDMSSMQGPPETTFSGQLRLSTKPQNQYNTEALMRQGSKIMDEKVNAMA